MITHILEKKSLIWDQYSKMSRSNPVDMFGEFDTGSNNSNSSSSDDESNTYNRQITWGSAAWQEVPNGIPTECYCGQPAIIKTYMHNAQNGRRYYSCAGPMDVRATATFNFILNCCSS